MKRLIGAVIVILAAFSPAFAQKIETAAPNRERIIHVLTALNHLTVIEVGEPVVTVASGSPAFKIEWRENKVFIEPTEPNVSTNLFIWTSSGRLNYELEPAGSVENMDFAIDHPKAVPVKTEARSLPPAADPASAAPRLADAFLGGELVNTTDVRPAIHRAQVILRDVVQQNQGLLIRYAIYNNSSRPYTVGAPQVFALRNPRSPRSLLGRRTSQLGEWEETRIKSEGQIRLSVLDQQIPQTTLAPGTETAGVLLVQLPATTSHPTLLRLQLASQRENEVGAFLLR